MKRLFFKAQKYINPSLVQGLLVHPCIYHFLGTVGAIGLFAIISKFKL